ncbi:MAG: 30S ribosomal protein S7 [Cyanobacteriota bacterium]|nr:MAG: 30S ribosomal protein S7 [Cyanobacteriota bacterium]
MPRRRIPKKRTLSPDPVYDNYLLHMIINRLMKKGKKSLASKLLYSTIKQIGETTQKDPVQIIEEAIRNVTPLVEVKARRVRGSTFQVPLTVSPERGTALGIRWIISSCRSRSGKNTISKLSAEFLDAAKNIGSAIRKKEEINRMAEANKAFAKYKS